MIKKILSSSWIGIVLLFMYSPILILAGYSFWTPRQLEPRAIFPYKTILLSLLPRS